MHYVYILQSLADPLQYYTGFTSEPEGRMAHHNSGASPHTARCRPWRMLVQIGFVDRAQALAFERYLKTGSGRAFAARHLR